MRLGQNHAAVFLHGNFPSFSEGLSLRLFLLKNGGAMLFAFPFLFGGTFIEAFLSRKKRGMSREFPFLFGGTFIEAGAAQRQ